MEGYVKVIDQINQSFEQFKSLILREVDEVKKLESFRLTPQQEVIMFYIIRKKRVTANEIAGYLNVSKSAISQVLPKLEAKQLIAREPNPENRREIFIHLGSRGQEYAGLLHKIDERLVEKYYSKVRLEELEEVLRILNKLIETVEDDATDKKG